MLFLLKYRVAYSVLACTGYQSIFRLIYRKIYPYKNQSLHVKCHFNKHNSNVPVHVGGIITVSISFHRLYLLIAFALSSLSSSMLWGTSCLKARIHGAILRAMAELHCVSTPKFVAHNVAAVESRPTSTTLRATNFFVYPPSAAFCAIVWCKFQCSANQISHSNLTADLIFAREWRPNLPCDNLGGNL